MIYERGLELVASFLLDFTCYSQPGYTPPIRPNQELQTQARPRVQTHAQQNSRHARSPSTLGCGCGLRCGERRGLAPRQRHIVPAANKDTYPDTVRRGSACKSAYDKKAANGRRQTPSTDADGDIEASKPSTHSLRYECLRGSQ